MIVVSDTTPISELAKINRLTLLRDVYQRVIIPKEVYDEVTAGPGVIPAAIQAATWIDVVTVRDSHRVLAVHIATRLGLGECAALILAEELDAQLLMDDRSARRAARDRGLSVTGTIGTLLVAKERGSFQASGKFWTILGRTERELVRNSTAIPLRPRVNRKSSDSKSGTTWFTFRGFKQGFPYF